MWLPCTGPYPSWVAAGLVGGGSRGPREGPTVSSCGLAQELQQGKARVKRKRSRKVKPRARHPAPGSTPSSVIRVNPGGTLAHQRAAIGRTMRDGSSVGAWVQEERGARSTQGNAFDPRTIHTTRPELYHVHGSPRSQTSCYMGKFRSSQFVLHLGVTCSVPLSLRVFLRLRSSAPRVRNRVGISKHVACKVGIEAPSAIQSELR